MQVERVLTTGTGRASVHRCSGRGQELRGERVGGVQRDAPAIVRATAERCLRRPCASAPPATVSAAEACRSTSHSNAPPTWCEPELLKVPLVHLTESMEQVCISVVEANNGLLPGRPTLAIGQPTAVDPSRAPEGAWILWIQMQELPVRLKGDALGEIAIPADGCWTEAVREALADRVQARLEAGDARLVEAGRWPARVLAGRPRGHELQSGGRRSVFRRVFARPVLLAAPFRRQPWRDAHTARTAATCFTSEPRRIQGPGWVAAPAISSRRSWRRDRQSTTARVIGRKARPTLPSSPAQALARAFAEAGLVVGAETAEMCEAPTQGHTRDVADVSGTQQVGACAIEAQISQVLHRAHAGKLLESSIQAAQADARELCELLGGDRFMGMGLQVFLNASNMLGQDCAASRWLHIAVVVAHASTAGWR